MSINSIFYLNICYICNGYLTIHSILSFTILNYIIQVNTSKGYVIKQIASFSQQEVDLSETPLFFPDGFEKVFLGIYFITLPYIAGLLFLFFYVAHGDAELFLSLNDQSSFILSWAIGYEIIASLLLLYIAQSAISFTMKNTASKGLGNGRDKDFHRP